MFNSQFDARQVNIDEVFNSLAIDVGTIIDSYQLMSDDGGWGLEFEVKEADDSLDSETLSFKVSIIDQEALRQEWISKMVKRFNKDKDARLTATTEVKVVDIRITTHEKNRPYFISRAVCRDGDKFDLDTGIAVAYAHAMDEEVPDFI